MTSLLPFFSLQQKKMIYLLVFLSLYSFLRFLVGFSDEYTAKRWALLSSCWQFFFAFLTYLIYVGRFVPLFYVGDTSSWLYGDSFNGYIFYDNLSGLFSMLTCFLTFISILIIWGSLSFRYNDFLAIIFLIQFLLFNIFFTGDLLVFYMLFEFLAVPMFLLIGIWGSRSRKIGAAYYLFFYTLGSSVLLLAVLALLYLTLGSTSYHSLDAIAYVFTDSWQTFMFWALFISFASKLPLVPFHIWLPEAHVEAPTVGSVILAGILLKVGGFGIIRYLIPVFTDQIIDNIVLLQTVGVVTALYAFSAATVQLDIKKVVAYSSIGHMAFVMLSAVTYTLEGLEASVLTMITHGFVSGAMFTTVGFIYDRYKTRNIFAFGGLTQLMPRASSFFFFFTLGNVSFPGTGAFISELGVFLSVSKLNLVTLCWLLVSTVVGVVYNFWMYVRVFMGSASDSCIVRYSDFNSRECFVLFTFSFFIVFTGIFPELFLFGLHSHAMVLLLVLS